MRGGGRLEDGYPSQLLTQRNGKDKQGRQGTLIRLAGELALRHLLPSGRERVTGFSDMASGLDCRQPAIEAHLLSNTLTGESGPLEHRVGTLGAVGGYPRTSVHVCDDGSAVGAAVGAGHGALPGLQQG